jgi:hypothetical protein
MQLLPKALYNIVALTFKTVNTSQMRRSRRKEGNVCNSTERWFDNAGKRCVTITSPLRTRKFISSWMILCRTKNGPLATHRSEKKNKASGSMGKRIRPT